jgi:tetratricopeptide (TPR) repeat protein
VLKDLDLDVSLSSTAFDPNSESLAVGTQGGLFFGGGKNSVVLLDPSNWRELQEIRYEGAVTDLAYSPDGLLLAVATQTELWSEREENAIRFWPLGDTAEKAELRYDGEVNAVAFQPDGTCIAAATYDRESRRGAAIIADPSEGKIVEKLEHEAAVSAVAFSPDGRHLATASADGIAHVWDVERAIRIARVEHDSSVHDVKFTSDSHHLITASADGTVRMWLWRPEDLVNEACARLSRNLTAEEWAQYLGDEAYRRTCSVLPTHYSMISAALKLARSGDVEAAIDQLRIIETSEPDLVPDALRMARQAAAEGLRARGQEAGIAGDMEHAIELFKQAADLDPTLGIDAQAEARRFAARGLVSRAQTHARQGSIEDATTAMQRAEALNANEVSAMAWNDLCWYGSLHEQAAAVMFACEKAVSLDPENAGIRDSRGLARALTGDREGAIDDFRFFVTQGQSKRQQYVLEQREQWIRQLEAGEDPFDRQTLKQLSSEF